MMKGGIIKILGIIVLLWGVGTLAYIGYSFWADSHIVLGITSWCIATIGVVFSIMRIVKPTKIPKRPAMRKWEWIIGAIAFVAFIVLLISGKASTIVILLGIWLALFLMTELILKIHTKPAN